MGTSRLVERITNFPFATAGIIAMNLLVAYLSRGRLQGAILDYGLVPADLGAGRFLSSSFIHDGYIHLFVNMTLLWLFGSPVEKAMGKLEYLMFYLGSCVASSLLHVGIVYATMPDYYITRAVVGASGAVAGVMGVYAVRFHRRQIRIAGVGVPVLLLIMLWLLLQLVLGVLGLYRDSVLGIGLKQVGYWSHLGGFAFGAVVALLANMPLQGEREYLLEQAELHEAEDNLLEAVANCETLLKYDPDNPAAHAGLGRLWAKLDDADESIPMFYCAVELHLSRGDEESALAAAEQMRRCWPNTALAPATRFRLATHLEEEGRYPQAVEALREIATEDSESPEAEMSLLKIGQIELTALDHPAEACVTLRELIDRYPETEWRSFAEQLLCRAVTKTDT